MILYRAILLFLPWPMQYFALPRGNFTGLCKGVTLNLEFGFNLVHVKYSQVSHIFGILLQNRTFL